MASTRSVPTPMPEALQHYWTMWNEPDVDKIRGHLDLAVATNIAWADPLHYYVGRDALEANVRVLRMDKPEYRFVLATEIDSHHLRLRYEWHMMRKHRVLLRGLDIVTLNTDGQIERVDGFFGPGQELLAEGSGIPDRFRLSS